MTAERLAHIFVLAFVLCSCVKTDLVEPAAGDGEAVVELDFGFRDFDEVRVETKATLDIIPESRVTNMFLFIFVGEQRYYAHFFDKTSLAPTLQDMREEEGESWYVENRTDAVSRTAGRLRIHAPECSGAEIYLVANIDSDMLNISPEKLNMISTRSELLNLVAVLNQELTSRNGLFPMTGTYTGGTGGPAQVDVTGNGIYPAGKTSGAVSVDLNRMDAKVSVNVRVATDNELTSTDGGITTVQRLKEFRPESWQVVNLPKGCWLASTKSSDPDTGFFSTEPVMFETKGYADFTYKDSAGVEHTVNSPVDGFSFYMVENRKTGKNAVSSFHERERRNKDAAGKYVTEGELWTNAPEDGTYLVIKGEVVMEVDVSSEARQQQLSADVTYYVHLGNIGSDLNDYRILRNTSYTYTITIKGVQNIELEVTSSRKEDGSPAEPSEVKENEPGAEGMVYVAKESIYTFDAHYGQRVFCFDAAYVDPDAVTWYVKTPFGREGTPDKIGDTEIPSGMDYKWVHFVVNDISETNAYRYTVDGITYRTASLAENPYSQYNIPYPGDSSDKLMDVVEFVEYIKAQKRSHDANLGSAFRTEFDQDWLDWYNRNHPDGLISDPATLVDGKPGPWFRDRIYVTVFVDEFYYDEDPITGVSDPQLWKRFVNQPNRMMHILCDNEKSLDKASSSTGSVVTIRQRSIQTPYNINDPELVSAWGCEVEDENADSYLWYYPSEKDNSGTGMSPENLGNTSVYNGLYNTARIWGCVKNSGTGGNSWETVKWSDYLDYNRPNDYRSSENGYNLLFLRDDKACLKYSAMMRNRDSNGNGVIDPDEIKWYSASIGQLEYLFFGELGLSEDAKLFPRKYSSADGAYPSGHPFEGVPMWKCHVVSSTNHQSYDNPQILWAEEGVSVSSYKQWPNDERGPYSMKCVRNLGLRSDSAEDFYADDAAHRPQDLIVMTRPEDATITSSSVYKFDSRRVNDKSKRFRTSIELEPYDENSEMSRLYDGFETGVLIRKGSVGVSGYMSLREMLQSGKSPCPDGYRVPNIREVVLMFLLTDSRDWWKLNADDIHNNIRIFTGTYYSLGPLGSQKSSYSGGDTGKPRYSWNTVSSLFGGDANINLNGDICNYIRCVRDWNPATGE